MILFNEAKAAVEKLEDDIDNIEEPQATNEGYDPDEAGMSQIMMESVEHWSVITEAICYADMNEMQKSFTSNTDIEALQEANIQGMFESVKQFFIKFWAKIKEYFENFLTKLNSWLLGEKKFIEKYRTQFTNANPSKFEKKGTDWADFNAMLDKMNSATSGYTRDKAVKTAESYVDTITKTGSNADVLSTTRETLEASTDTFRASLLGSNANISKADFGKYLKWTLRNGGRVTDKAPTQYMYGKDNVDKSKIITELTSAEDTKKNIAKMQKNMKELFKSILNEIEKHEKRVKDERRRADKDDKNYHSDVLSIYHAMHRTYKNNASSASKMCGALTSALRSRNGEYKALVVSYIAWARPNTGKGLKESADFDPEEIADIEDIDTEEKDMSESFIGAYLKTRGFSS